MVAKHRLAALPIVAKPNVDCIKIIARIAKSVVAKHECQWSVSRLALVDQRSQKGGNRNMYQKLNILLSASNKLDKEVKDNCFRSRFRIRFSVTHDDSWFYHFSGHQVAL